jgi:hypothetical protein
MLRAKSEQGHVLYEEWRSKETSPERRAELVQAQLAVYGAAMRNAAPEWKEIVGDLIQEAEGMGGSSPNNARNVSAETWRPDDTISPMSAGTQPPPRSGMAQASPDLGSTAAGRRSQSNSQSSMSEDVGQMSLDLKPYTKEAALIKPKDDPVPVDDITDATLGKPEDVKQMYETFGLKEDGSFDELDDIAQMADEGRLSPEDEMEMSTTERDMKNATAYGKVLKAAVACIS